MGTSSSPRPPLATSTMRLFGTSAAVSTAITPGRARAAETSIEAMRALGSCDLTTRPNSMPGSCQSAA